MRFEELKAWRKVAESDLFSIGIEIKAMVDLPMVLFLEGNLGAGKTTFAGYFIDDREVVSPTYKLISEIGLFLHADFYRLNDAQELYFLGIEDYLADKKYFLVEWGIKHFSTLNQILPEEFNYYKLDISQEQLSDFRNIILSKIHADF